MNDPRSDGQSSDASGPVVSPSAGRGDHDGVADATSTPRRHYVVHGIRGTGSVSEAERERAGAILERDFRAYERFRKSLPKEEPPTEPSKIIPVWPAGAEQPIDLIQFLTDTLQHLGYAPAGRNAYEDHNELGFRACWSSPTLEHFVSFNSWGRPTQYFSASVSLGHTPADKFADQEVLNFLPAAYRDIYARQPIWRRNMWLKLAQIASQGPGASLDISQHSRLELAHRIDEAMVACTVARVSSINDIEGMFRLSFGDEEPFPWPKWGSSARVAMVAYLGRKLGRDADDLRPVLIPHVQKFKSPPNTSEPSAEEFVDRVLEDADTALAAA